MSELFAVPPFLIFTGKCKSVCVPTQLAVTPPGSEFASGDDGGVLMTEGLKGPEPTKTEPRGLEEKLCVGESSSELSEASLLASEFTLLVSKIWLS